MPFTYGTATDIPEILGVLATRIAARCSMHASLVFPTLADDEDLAKTPPGDTFVTLRVGRFTPVPGHYAGGSLATFRGAIAAQLWHRTDVDQARKAGDYVAAVMNRWLYLFDALQGFSPARVSDATLGLTLEGISAADQGFEVPARRPPKWGRLDSWWGLRFVQRRPA